MRFVTTISLTDSSPTSDPARSSNGALTLLQLPDRRVGVTCQHVIEAFRERRSTGQGRVCRVGARPISLLDRLLAEDRRLDLALLDLDDTDPDQLVVASRRPEFFEPDTWPQPSPEPGDVIGLGGYPSILRTQDRVARATTTASFPPGFTVGATRVIDVGRENIVCGLGEGHWIGDGHHRVTSESTDLGGLSGGPGFVRRRSRLHLAGVMFVVARRGDYLRLRPAGFIRPDGTLRA